MADTKPPAPHLPTLGEACEDPDFTVEGGLFVFTRSYLARRGHCCGSGCRNCPYRARPELGAARPPTTKR